MGKLRGLISKKRNPTKKALLIGINKYKPDLNADLRGCINDVENMRAILVDIYKFNPENIRIVLDDRATKKSIEDRLYWLTDNPMEGDELVFHFSGHGCFSGDTEIRLLNGTTKTMKDLAQNHKDDTFWVYSCTKSGEIVPGKAHSPRMTKIAKVMKITLDNDESIICTEDHLFMLRDGTYAPARSLTKNTSLMPLYTKLSNKASGDRIDGYELVFVPNSENIPNSLLYSNNDYFYTHQIVGYYEDMITKGYKGVLHHKDFNKLNNDPDNLELMNRRTHSKLHAQTKEHKKKSKDQIINYNKNTFPKKIKEDDEFRAKFGKASSKARKKDWLCETYRAKVVAGLKKSYKNIGDDDPRIQSLHDNRWKSHTSESRKKAVESFRITASNKESSLYKANHSIERKIQLKQINKKANHIRWHVNRGIINENCELCNTVIKNHKVINAEYLNIEIPVYDIAVEKYHNFAIKAGVFVHNSQVRDRNGDELDDGLDEILCPYDMNWDDPLLDDWLGDLFGQLKPGVHLTMVCDSCHSATMTRTLQQNPHYSVPRYILPPFDIRSRSLGLNLSKNTISNSIHNQNHVLMSGCEDHQTSADAYINNKYQGAMSWALTTIIKQNPDATWPEIHNKVCGLLKGKFTQNPQLSGNDDLLRRPIFGGC